MTICNISVCNRLFLINPKMYLFHHLNWTIRFQYRFRPNSFLCSSSMSVRAGAVSSASPKLSQTSKIIHQWSHISVINNSDNKYAANAFDTRSDYDHFNCQKFPWINFFSSLGLNQILPSSMVAIQITNYIVKIRTSPQRNTKGIENHK